jgi:hypothetical protein
VSDGEWSPVPGHAGYVTERVIGDQRVVRIDAPPGMPYESMVLGPLYLYQRCRCPWWHRLPFIRRRVHASLP